MQSFYTTRLSSPIRRPIQWFFLLSLLLCTTTLYASQEQAPTTENTVSIPLAALDVNQATATVSVLQEPQSATNKLLDACQDNLPDEFVVEGHDLSEQIKKLCKMAKGFTRRYLDTPTHTLESKAYLMTIPLKHPEQDIHALTWKSATLDDALAFMTLLQSGNLQALKAYTRIPWGKETTQPCRECPITELVFNMAGMKAEGEFKE